MPPTYQTGPAQYDCRPTHPEIEGFAAASRNPMFALLVRSFHVITRHTWAIGWHSRPSDAQRMASVDGHRAIAAAIAGRDHQAAETAMAEHFDMSVKALLAAGIN